MVINPFDEIAVEEALRILDGGDGGNIVVSIGGDEAAQELRRALAIGATAQFRSTPKPNSCLR